jgi:adenosylcobinamide-phosphate synthase
MRVGHAAARPLGLLLGYGADLLLGDPRRWHPVAGFGRLAAALERRTYRDSRAAGARHTAALVAAAVGVGVLAERATRRSPTARTALTAAATWVVLGGRTLRREAAAVSAHLESDDLPAARRRITHLVGRNPESLDEAGIAGRAWNRWPRTPPTPWSRRCGGGRSPGCPGSSATGRSTPWTR